MSKADVYFNNLLVIWLCAVGGVVPVGSGMTIGAWFIVELTPANNYNSDIVVD